MSAIRPGDDSPLLRAAMAVAKGASVDWPGVASDTSGDPDALLAVEQLQIVSRIAALHTYAADDAAAARANRQAVTRLGRWGSLQLQREIGRGRFGTVYLAWDPRLERDVALKILHDARSTGPIMREARMLARVRHPNVVMVFRVEAHGGRAGLGMEFVDGRPLKEVLEATGVFGAHEAAVVGCDLCRAVAAVHKAGLVHRDIKVQNVMRESAGRIVLMDFGAGEVQSDDPGAPRRVTGTPLYLAPEVFAGAPQTPASDIYSLGVLLYHLTTLTYPVTGETFEDVEAAQARRDAVPLADRRPDLPADFVTVVDRALERDPAARYRSAGAMLQDLAKVFGGGGRAAAVDERPRAELPSVAVLPFKNLGPDQDLDYLCAGLAQELLAGLGNVSGLRLVSRTWAVGPRQGTANIESICRQLNAETALDGTVEKAGDHLRINAYLVRAADGRHLWSDGYMRRVSDVADHVQIQNEIAQSVVDRLKVALSEVPAGTLVRPHTRSAEAFDLYLRGRDFWAHRYHGGLRAAVRCFNEAIDKDPIYALAYAGLADAYAFLGFYSITRPRDAFREAMRHANRALQLEPELSEAHTSRGLIKLGHDWDWADAEKDFRLACTLGPASAPPRIYLSWLRILKDDVEDGFAIARDALAIEPDTPLIKAGVAYAHFLARDYERAVTHADDALAAAPDTIVATYVKGMCRAQQGQLDEAIELMERAVEMSQGAPFYLGLLGNLYARRGMKERVDALLAKLHEKAQAHAEDETKPYVPPHCFAYVYAGLGDLDAAFAWEAKAYPEGASPFNYFSPVIENLHRDPRHMTELRRMGYSQ